MTKKVLLIMFIVMLIALNSQAKNYTLGENITATGESNYIDLTSQVTALKAIYFEFASGTVTMTINIKIGTVKKGSATINWATTATYTLTGTAASLSNDGSSIPSPFIVTSANQAAYLKVSYTITAGTIAKILLTTSL